MDNARKCRDKREIDNRHQWPIDEFMTPADGKAFRLSLPRSCFHLRTLLDPQTAGKPQSSLQSNIT